MLKTSQERFIKKFLNDMSEEIWKDIKGFEGIYQVSNLGRVKSLERSDAIGRNLKERILKPQLNHTGYYQVGLWKQSIVKHYMVHRLVWEAFNGQIPEDLQVNHINEVKTDNRLENLNLMTCKENINYGTHNERGRNKQTNRKDLSKPVLQFTLEGILIKEYPSINQVERDNGFNHSHISACCKGKLKQAYNYIWKYKE